MKRRMTLLDSSFIRVERTEAPQHGAVLVIFAIPEGSPPDYVGQLATRMRKVPVTRERFNWGLSKSLADKVALAWKVLPPNEIELEYHFHHSALPQPGGELELGLLVSRLATTPVLLDRPPWEMHLIEGLQGNRFAILLKMHHALIDGMTGLKMIRSWMSEDPGVADAPPLWAESTMPPKSAAPKQMTSAGAPSAIRHLQAGFSSVRAVTRALAATVAATRGAGDGLVAPYRPPRTIFNGPITPRRRVSTATTSLSRMRAVADAIDGTINDAISVVFAGALRQYLLELDGLPDRPLVCAVVASLRQAVDKDVAEKSGNVISFIFADMATEIDDVAERARRIVRSTRAGKEHLLGLREAAMSYSSVMMLPFVVTAVTGTGHHLPMFNVALSNVPGVNVPLYWNGARSEALHATTIITSGEALVVTVTSWDENLCLTFTACPDTIPHPQRLSVYFVDAVDEVERTYGL